MTLRRRAPAAALLAALVAAAAGCTFATPPTPSAPTASPSAPSTSFAPPTPPPPTASPAPGSTVPGSPGPGPATPSPTPASPATDAPSPGADAPTPDAFWALAERGIRSAGRLEVEIDGPAAALLRFQAAASATVVDGVVGFVCVDGQAYDGQSGFERLPGTWTCGAPALVAGFRSIGQPIDAWSSDIPADAGRRETVTVSGDRWTWRYRATSPYLGGEVRATVTLDRSTRRVVAARREDPIGTTRYTFRYGADFERIAVPD